MDDLFDRIVDASVAWSSANPPTPLERSAGLSAAIGCELFLKCEHLQPTGSFKVRGAGNKIRLLDREALREGVITASTGNHGRAVARAAAAAGTKVSVHISSLTPPAKIEAIRALGAEIVLVDAPAVDVELLARRAAERQGKVYISPYNDPDVIAGQGTLGVELHDQAPELDAVFIAVGGGGLIAGVGTAMKRLSPGTRIVGVWPESSPSLLRSMEAGRIVDAPQRPTLSDATAGDVEEGAITLPLCRTVIDETVEVPESDIAAAMRDLAEAEHWIVEGAAALALAGLRQRAPAYRGAKVAVVLCGRNIALDTFLRAVAPAA